MQGPPADAKVSELSHSVAVRFERGAGLLTVTRQLHNDSADYQEVNHLIPLPEGAIATALRIGAGERWQTETLLASDEAEERWNHLTGPGEAAPSTIGLLQWSWGAGVDLSLFGIAPGATVTVEYDLELPPRYEAGSLAFDYPREDSWKAPEFHFSRAPAATAEEVRDEDPQSNRGVVSFRVRQPRPEIDRVDARWALYPLAGRMIWRLELDAAVVLEPAPARPNVVFVIDASHSEGPEGIAAQLELLAPYLANAPDAQVELVLYRRSAQRLFGRFVPAGDVARLLAGTAAEQLAPGNGSNLELGARLAAEALSQLPGPGRIVLFTDERLRDGFSNQAAIAGLARAPRDTVVHLVERQPTGGSLLNESRDDNAPLAPIAAASGGVFLRVGGHPVDPEQAAHALLGLVRPIRIDHFTIEARGLAGDQLDVPTELLEGSTLRLMALAERPPEQLTLTGKIWARDFRRVISIDGNLADRMPGLAIGDDELRAQLTDEEVRAAARSSHAVSPLTSYLSAPPDAAPSTIGVVRVGLGGISGSGVGCYGGSGCGFSFGCTGEGTSGVAPDYPSLLRALLAPGVERCERQYGDATLASVSLEATGDEVVAVETAAPSPELSACITEAAWSIRLSLLFTAHQTYRVDLRPSP